MIWRFPWLKINKKVPKKGVSQKKRNKKSSGKQLWKKEAAEDKNIKMSEILTQFVEPYMDWAENKDSFQKVVTHCHSSLEHCTLS